jgi:hypothetical protein
MTKRTVYRRGIIFMVVVLLVLLPGCLRLDYTEDASSKKNTAKYEITKIDIFSLENPWTSKEVSVFGVQLGDTKEDVVEKIGLPDLRTDYTDSSNWEYSKGLAMPKIGLLFHFIGEKLVRITFKASFNRFLSGKTKIGSLDKEAIYREFRAPSKLQLLTFFTMYTYEEKGLEIFLNGRKMNGFSLVSPQGITELAAAPEKMKDDLQKARMAEIRKNVFGEEPGKSEN